MKKRWLALALAVIALALCACGSGKKTAAPEDAIPTEVQEGSSQVTLFENDACALTLESVGKDALGDYCWEISMENKTGDKLIFSVDQVYVNEFEADPYWAQYADAMRKTPAAISWSSARLDACGIRSVDRVDFVLSVYRNGDSGDLIANEKITVYPNGEAAYQPVAYEAGPDDTVLADTPEAYAAATGCDPDGEWGYYLNVYLENRSGSEQEYTVQNVKINGQLCDPYWYRTVDAGKRSFTYINWYTDELAHMEIYEVSKIEFDLIVNDANTGAEVLKQHCVVEQ